MLFTDGAFTPERIRNPQVRSALCAIAECGPPIIGSCDLLGGVVRYQDAPTMATLTKAIQPGFSLEHLRSALPNDSSGAVRVPVRSRSRSSFTTQALASLDQFEAALQLFEGVLDGMEMLVLAHCVLVQMDEHDRQTLAPLDTERAAALFLEQVFQGIDFQPFVDKLLGLACRSVAAAPEKIDPKEEAWLLPADIAPSEDLTFRARTAAQPAQLPYDGDRAYERVFDAVTRTFHSLQTRHVLLIGERGVGKTTALAELARRAATGAVPLLAECRKPRYSGWCNRSQQTRHNAGRKSLASCSQ